MVELMLSLNLLASARVWWFCSLFPLPESSVAGSVGLGVSGVPRIAEVVASLS